MTPPHDRVKEENSPGYMIKPGTSVTVALVYKVPSCMSPVPFPPINTGVACYKFWQGDFTDRALSENLVKFVNDELV